MRGSDMSCVSLCPDEMTICLTCACHVMLDEQVVVAVDCGSCVEQGCKEVLLYVPDLSVIAVDAFDDVLDMVSAKLHESALDHIGGEAGP